MTTSSGHPIYILPTVSVHTGEVCVSIGAVMTAQEVQAGGYWWYGATTRRSKREYIVKIDELNPFLREPLAVKINNVMKNKK